jgi:transcriptional regulator with XRE-family HTH domain
MTALLAKVTYFDYDPTLLVQAREARRMSQEEVAAALETTNVTISRVEKKRHASFEIVSRLCTYYGLPEASVMWEVNPPALHRSTKNFLRKPT